MLSANNVDAQGVDVARIIDRCNSTVCLDKVKLSVDTTQTETIIAVRIAVEDIISFVTTPVDILWSILDNILIVDANNVLKVTLYLNAILK